ncbi:MAG: CHAT domain-containing protein [Chloroflexota bacterium]|nr:CHAT domain-containing protein [Chloroflexota bacterium]
MPIPQKDINTNWIWVSPNEMVEQIQTKLSADRKVHAYQYIVFATTDGKYVVARWLEVEQLARMSGQDIRTTPIGMLQGLPQPVIGVEQDSMGLNAANEERDAQPGKRLVVLSNGQPIGLLTREMLSGDVLPPDPFVSIPKRPTVLGIEGDSDELIPKVPTTLGGEAGQTAPAEPKGDNRVINGWVDGIGKSEPLRLKRTYDLKFDVSAPRAESIVRVGGVSGLVNELAADQEFLEILVVLEPGDFRLYGMDQQLIVVPRVGDSKNIVTYTIEAQKEGSGTATALFYVNNRLFQKVTITFQVGGIVSDTPTVVTKAVGIALQNAISQPARRSGQSVNVMIIKKDEGYQFIVQGGGVARALLRISEPQIADWIKYARKELKGIVHKQVDGQLVYQDDNTSIATEIHAESLKTLAQVGFSLYDGLFYGNNGADAQAMGQLLSELSQKRQLNIQIAGERFFFPWSLLYDRDNPDDVDSNGFWGFKHIIEYTPEFTQTSLVNFDPTINVGDTMDIGFVCNNGIDTQFSRPIVAGQREFLNALAGVSVKDYSTVADLVSLLLDTNAPPLIYVYCHAVSKFPSEDGGVDDSTLALTGGKTTLRELKRNASTRRPVMSRAPLIYVNACESAELSPYLYDGLVPYLLARGARGVIGTEVETPALFAAEFAKDFIKRFAAGGQPLGELLLDMRREYLEQKNNVMGLVYALYSSGDVVVQRSA